MATAYSHVPPFYLTSGTGGLQEAITANQTSDGPTRSPHRGMVQVIAAGKCGQCHRLRSRHRRPGSRRHHHLALHVLPVERVAVYPGGSLRPAANYNQGWTGAVTADSDGEIARRHRHQRFWRGGRRLLTWPRTRPCTRRRSRRLQSGKAVYVPAGNYLLDNSAAAVLSGRQERGHLGRWPIVFFDLPDNRQLRLHRVDRATGFGLSNLTLSFGPTATARTIRLCARRSILHQLLLRWRQSQQWRSERIPAGELGSYLAA